MTDWRHYDGPSTLEEWFAKYVEREDDEPNAAHAPSDDAIEVANDGTELDLGELQSTFSSIGPPAAVIVPATMTADPFLANFNYPWGGTLWTADAMPMQMQKQAAGQPQCAHHSDSLLDAESFASAAPAASDWQQAGSGQSAKKRRIEDSSNQSLISGYLSGAGSTQESPPANSSAIWAAGQRSNTILRATAGICHGMTNSSHDFKSPSTSGTSGTLLATDHQGANADPNGLHYAQEGWTGHDQLLANGPPQQPPVTTTPSTAVEQEAPTTTAGVMSRRCNVCAVLECRRHYKSKTGYSVCGACKATLNHYGEAYVTRTKRTLCCLRLGGGVGQCPLGAMDRKVLVAQKGMRKKGAKMRKKSCGACREAACLRHFSQEEHGHYFEKVKNPSSSRFAYKPTKELLKRMAKSSWVTQMDTFNKLVKILKIRIPREGDALAAGIESGEIDPTVAGIIEIFERMALQ